MAEIDMSWVTEEQTVEDTFEIRSDSEFEGFKV